MDYLCFLLDIGHILKQCLDLQSLSITLDGDKVEGDFYSDDSDDSDDDEVNWPDLRHLKFICSPGTWDYFVRIHADFLCESFSSTLESAELMSFPPCPMNQLETLIIHRFVDGNPIASVFDYDDPEYPDPRETPYWPGLKKLTLLGEHCTFQLKEMVHSCPNLRELDLNYRSANSRVLETIADGCPFAQKLKLSCFGYFQYINGKGNHFDIQ